MEKTKNIISEEIWLENKAKSFCSDLFRIHILYDKKISELKIKNEKIKMNKILSFENEKLSSHREQNFHINSKRKSDIKFYSEKLKIEKISDFQNLGKKKPQIRFSSLQKYDKLAQLTHLKSNNKNSIVNYNQSFHLTPIKIPQRQLNELSKENDLSYISTNQHNHSRNEKNKLDEESYSVNYAYQKSYSNLPCLNLDNYENMIRKYSPIRTKGESTGGGLIKIPDLEELDKIYQNIKKDLTNLKP
jgi:hypothetical protein